MKHVIGLMQEDAVTHTRYSARFLNTFSVWIHTLC